MSDAERIAENLAEIHSRIATAARQSGRDADSVKLIAVTKYVGVTATRRLVEAGCCDLGESRPQDLIEKAAAFGNSGVNWHLIGQLQRNKIRRTLPAAKLIHSVDSLKTLQAVDRIAGELDLIAEVLLEINISGDVAKHGFSVNEIDSAWEQCPRFGNVNIRGLMTMAARTGGEDGARKNFAELRTQRDRLQRSCPEGVSLAELSMGMSEDFEVAIEEGSTMVRIGSALFAGLSTL